MSGLARQTTLSKEASQVFNMTLDELQNTVGSGKPFGSMNMDEFLATVWDRDQLSVPGLPTEPAFTPDIPMSLPALHSQQSGVQQDYSGKTVEEVWSAIHSNKSSNAYETVTLGNFLQSVGLDLPASVSSDSHLSNLQLPVAPHVKAEPMVPDMSHLPSTLPQLSTAAPSQQQPGRLDTALRQAQAPTVNGYPPRQPPGQQVPLNNLAQQRGAAFARHATDRSTSARSSQGGYSAYEDQDHPDGEVHAMATIRMASSGPRTKDGRVRRKAGSPPLTLPNTPRESMPFIEAPPPGAHARTARQRKRKEPDVVDERTARLQKRMVKNRESAARSRARKQEYTAQLEVQVAELRRENRLLLEKVVRACPPSKDGSAEGEPLRRTRTMPAMELADILPEQPALLNWEPKAV